MPDLYFTETGDLAVASSGDLAITRTAWRHDVQQAYMRMMTDIGDFRVYPSLGSSLSRLYGQPQSPATGQKGVDYIRSALDRESVFTGKTMNVKAIPVGPQSIRFDVSILVPYAREQVTVSVEQELEVT